MRRRRLGLSLGVFVPLGLYLVSMVVYKSDLSGPARPYLAIAWLVVYAPCLPLLIPVSMLAHNNPKVEPVLMFLTMVGGCFFWGGLGSWLDRTRERNDESKSKPSES